MKRLVTLTFLFLLSLPASSRAWAQSTGVPSSPTAFADWLVAQGEYARAAGEYYRALFAAPEEEKEGLLRAIGSCHFKAGEYRRAVLVFEKIIAVPESPLFADACFQAAYGSLKLGEYGAVSALAEKAETAGPLPPPFILLAATGRLSAGDYDTGGLLLDRYLDAPGAAAIDRAKELAGLAAEAGRLPTRSTWAAGVFSALLPGAGKIYAGRWEDGLVSFFLCAGLGALSAYSFWSGGVSSFSAWTYAVLGAIFYIGDIWGSAVAAGRFNEDRRRELSLRVKASVDVLFP